MPMRARPDQTSSQLLRKRVYSQLSFFSEVEMCKRSVLAFLSAVLAITFPITAAAQAPAATPSGSPAAQAAGDAAGTSDKAVALRLADHTMLVGTIVSEDASTIVLDAGVLGKITLK